MSDKLEVIITGKNGVSRIFKEVTSDATTMGTSVETASKKGAASFSAWTSGAQKAGAAFATLALVSTKISGEAEASQARLTGAFENAGLAIDDYAESIAKLQDKGLKLAFDDEDVADSIAKLVGVTKDAGRAFEDLALAQNIARGENISLAQATGIVEAAETGRFRALASIGIKLDETATKEEYLAAAREKYAGASERYAKTGAADFERWGNTAENALETVGSKLTSIQGPLLALSAGSSIIGTVSSALKDTGAASAIASAAMGPAGLAGAALLAAGGVAYLVKGFIEYRESANAAADATINLKDLVYSLAGAGADQTLTGPLNELTNAWGTLAADASKAETDYINVINQLSDANQQLQGATSSGNQALLDQSLALVQSLEAQRDALDASRLSGDQIDSITQDIQDLFRKPAIDAKAAAKDIEWYFELFRTGQIDQQTLVNYIDESAQDWTRYSTAVVEATDAHIDMTAAINTQTAAMNTQAGELSNLIDLTSLHAWVESVGLQQNLADAYGKTASVVKTENIPSADRLTSAMDAQIQRAKDITAAIADYGDALGNIPNLEARSAQGFAARAGQAGAALGDAFRVAVGNTNAIGSQSSQVADWAKELIGVSGQYAKIDDLLARGVITQDQYNAAQAAGTKIFDANARIQDDILEIQSKQAPLLADLTEEQARYMDHLADLPASQQLVRLGFMDSAESAKALAAAELAAAAANGELGAAGEETATKMITAAAEADPVLRAMLENMGLISVGADGTITVNFDSVEDANASLDDVVGILRELRDVIAEVFGIVIDSNAASQRDALQGVIDRLNELNGKQVTYYVSASGNGVSVGSPNGPGIAPIANGGVIAAANGYAGDVLVGEFGPELLRRSGGGALVLPTGATQSRMATGGGMGALHFHFTNNTFMGISDLTEQVTRELVPAIKLAFENHYQGHGVR